MKNNALSVSGQRTQNPKSASQVSISSRNMSFSTPNAAPGNNGGRYPGRNNHSYQTYLTTRAPAYSF